MSIEWNPISRTVQYTNHSISERTSYEPELSNFMGQSISDWVQNLGNIIIWREESLGWLWVKSNVDNYAIHQPLHCRTNFVRTLNVQFHGPIDIGLSPKLGERHHIVGEVIWCVVIDIQSLELHNTPTPLFHNELRMNLNCPISWTNRYGIESKTWGTS